MGPPTVLQVIYNALVCSGACSILTKEHASDLELDKRAVVDVIFHYFTGGLQEQCLVGRELMEDNFLNG